LTWRGGFEVEYARLLLQRQIRAPADWVAVGHPHYVRDGYLSRTWLVHDAIKYGETPAIPEDGLDIAGGGD
jgi:hypothetical protein